MAERIVEAATAPSWASDIVRQINNALARIESRQDARLKAIEARLTALETP